MPALTPAESSASREPTVVFDTLRGRLFGIAYRMLGSAAEAEDLVQDVWLRWQGTDRAAIDDATGFLVATTTRLAINVVTSARARREAYVGLWLPEPVDTSDDPELGAAKSEALELAVLLLLERLSPTERAAYVLREAFDYPHAQIASILDLTEEHVRQLVVRARKHVADERRTSVSAAEQRRLLHGFIAAAQRGDVASLEALLAADVVSRTDGGGVPRAAPVPVSGRARVAKFTASFPADFWAGATVVPVVANGAAGALLLRDDVPYAFVTVAASDAGVGDVLWILNPEKLRTIASSITAHRAADPSPGPAATE
ncbi:putative RNA polymerase sigma factor [Minicystis rosea]|nr:putative RNA polymerase sigma factor [Minicystis rosea]